MKKFSQYISDPVSEQRKIGLTRERRARVIQSFLTGTDTPGLKNLKKGLKVLNKKKQMIRVETNPNKKIGYEIRNVGPGGKSTVAKRENWSKKISEDTSPAWQRKEGKNPEGGLNAAGVASYRRQNPGSKLQTAVTTKPSKLKPGSKSANRRKSFCSRMKGMKAKLTSAATARDPDSRINKSLRKWNC